MRSLSIIRRILGLRAIFATRNDAQHAAQKGVFTVQSGPVRFGAARDCVRFGAAREWVRFGAARE